VSRAVATSWECSPIRCNRIVISALNALAWIHCDATPHVAKWSVNRAQFELLAETARLTAWLDTQGIPVSAPIPSLSGAHRVQADEASIELQRVQPGELLDAAQPGQAFAAGETLGRLHDALRNYPHAAALTTADPGEPTTRIAAWLADHGTQIPPGVGEELLRRVPHALLLEAELQLVHRDYRASNLIWHDGRVAAVLDFEDVGADYSVVDLAKAAAMLATRFRDWRPTPPHAIGAFVAGYKSARPLSAAEASSLQPLIAWQLLVTSAAGWSPELWVDAAAEHLRASGG
jgi:homoserine kinase type II